MFSALFDWLLGAGREAAVFIISMVPLVELRGAVPLGAAAGIPWTTLFPLAILGNMLPVPFIYLFARRILLWGKDKPVIGRFFTFCLEKGERGGEKLQAKAGRGLFWALLLFVGIPLPGTGAWTGALVAAFLNIRLRNALPAITLGVLIAGGLVTLMTMGVIRFL